MIKDDASRAIMKKAEIKGNIFDIAADVFSDTQVLFAYLSTIISGRIWNR
jgi:hypothetical protein